MKKLFILLAIGTCLLGVGCGDDDSDKPTLEDFITATINNTSFETQQITAVTDSSLGEELIFILGTNTDATFSIGLNIPVNIPTNEAQLIDETDFGITFTDDDDNAFFTDGELELTSHDTEANIIEGTFSFTARDEINTFNNHTITNGSFRISY